MSESRRRIVAFVDIRGFTRLSHDVHLHPLLPALLFELYVDLNTLLQRHSLDADSAPFVKSLGDGAMLLLGGSARPGATLPRLLALVRDVELRFQERMGRANRSRGTALQAQLGWGIARGEVIAVRESQERLEPAFPKKDVRLARGLRGDDVLDYYGPMISLAKRICDKARPSGVCIDAVSFKSVPDQPCFDFSRRKLKGVKGIAEEVPVWFSRFDPAQAREGGHAG